MLRAVILLIVILATAKSFLIPCRGRSRLLPKLFPNNHGSNCFLAPLQLFQVAEVDEIKPGDRKIVDTEAGAVIVANVDGKFFAVNAKCPHLGLPMKKGKIEKDASGNPTITCNFHNSVFSLSDGSCTAWCTGILGNSGGFFGKIAQVSGSLGGEKNSPATTYPCTVEDNKVFLDIN